MYEFFARAYDPIVGVWIQQDVYRGRLPEPMTLHRYRYVGNNPVNYVDLLGLRTIYVHGTFSEAPSYSDYETIDTIDFIRGFSEQVWNDTDVDYSFNWSGGNSKSDRLLGAIELAVKIYAIKQANPCEEINIMAHSHGGNVTILALGILKSLGILIDNVAFFATPVRDDYSIPENSVKGKIYNIYSPLKTEFSLSVKLQSPVKTYNIGPFSIPTGFQPVVDIDVSFRMEGDGVQHAGEIHPFEIPGSSERYEDYDNIVEVSADANEFSDNPTNIKQVHSDLVSTDLAKSSEVCRLTGYCEPIHYFYSGGGSGGGGGGAW